MIIPAKVDSLYRDASFRDRIIMHVDMNSYFASVEQQANPLLRGKPVGVGGPNDGRTVMAAVSIEAKKFGCKSGMSVYEARKLCPGIIFVQGDFPKYAQATRKILEIFIRYTPLMEAFSIDEAFLDVTDTAGSYEGAISVARRIKKAIRREVGEWLTCSVGIAPNKLVAKLASDLKKPDGLIVVRKEQVRSLLRRVKLDDLCGIGSRTKKNLLSLGIDTTEKLGETPLPVLVRRFGKLGFVLSMMGRGEDCSPVVPYYLIPEPKSMGHSYTLPRDTADRDVIWSTLLRLSEQVGRRLRAEGFLGRTVSAGIRLPDFTSMWKQKALKTWIDDGYRIYQEARHIIEGFGYSGPVRLLGVSVSGLAKGYYQSSFFPEDERREKLLDTLDALNDRFGEFTVARASLLFSRIRKGVSGMGASRTLSRSQRNQDRGSGGGDGAGFLELEHFT